MEELLAYNVPPPEDYVLGTEDLLNIVVYGEPDLTTVARVDHAGYIVMPLVGKIEARGLTAAELKQSIETHLEAGYLVHPDVRIILQEYRQSVVHVFGQVATPGPYRLTHADTLLEIISKSGGFTPVAKRKKVKILRKGPEGSRVFYVDTTRITGEGRLEEDVLLMPGDVVIVPERFF